MMSSKEEEEEDPEQLSEIPSRHILTFGEYTMSSSYREALYKFAPFYCVEEIVGTYLGHNEQFPSEEDWMNGVRPEHSSPR